MDKLDKELLYNIYSLKKAHAMIIHEDVLVRVAEVNNNIQRFLWLFRWFVSYCSHTSPLHSVFPGLGDGPLGLR